MSAHDHYTRTRKPAPCAAFEAWRLAQAAAAQAARTRATWAQRILDGAPLLAHNGQRVGTLHGGK